MASSTGGDVVRRSLLDSTAGAFAQRALSEASSAGMAFGGSSGGSAGGGSWGDAPVLRRSLTTTHSGLEESTHGDPDAQPGSFDISRLPARQLQRLVDVVVDAIEQRVIDELERRGRRHPGVF